MTPANLKELLKTLSLTQSALSLALGVSEKTASQWTTGKGDIPGYVPAYLRELQSRIKVELERNKLELEIETMQNKTKELADLIASIINKLESSVIESKSDLTQLLSLV